MSDLEHAFSQVHPDEFLPTLAPTASAFVQLMLDADEPVIRADALEATGHSGSSWERALSGTDTSAALRTLGLVEGMTKNGTVAYTATLAPWWFDGRDPATGAPASDCHSSESVGSIPVVNDLGLVYLEGDDQENRKEAQQLHRDIRNGTLVVDDSQDPEELLPGSY